MPPVPSADRRLSSCLMGLIFGLILVGLVSGTPLRHVVQVLPACIVLVVLSQRASWSPYAATAIFAFWLLIMALIWLYLLGVARIITGDFTKTETILTVFIAGWCLLGLFHFVRTPTTITLTTRIVSFVAFALLQVGALWLSLQPYLSHR